MGQKELQQVAHEDFVLVVSQDDGFRLFVAEVTPEGQVQQVWLAEAIALLKLLWEIYQILKALGFFDWIAKFFAVRKTKKAMRVILPYREAAVAKVRDELKAKYAA